jgi:hypothetical protein
MPDLLLELFSEEIPARMQRKAAEDLKTLVTNALVDAGLPYEGAKAFATPRRLPFMLLVCRPVLPRPVKSARVRASARRKRPLRVFCVGRTCLH